ncbi:hypothetical protein CHGG_03240 [Chaetomium globosum CBS 148.51]|uniref:Zn(2)-C6 fungal-type domain-containing protein n=1 Tax=Chaetomium globosum (strain ATCC 6205 / CBS 148.51 / DSM 1962 / NBRC 6347 / NRRL 1970) TaxID=306901 RepID=Q2H964_CHAGB|nr:uncharacterized protein CHGG_03240 [Chaetomium globosum CBS 148.51]EAQ91305.1 hypothetical protein CHGG_03240 [Chaetomium globosum CBS 148.51]
MASASVSSGTSPLSGLEFEFPPDSTREQDEAFWTAISNPSSGSLGLLSSPAHSLGSSWAVLPDGQLVELQHPSPAALPSPLHGDFDQPSPYSTAVEQSRSGVYGDVSFFHGLDNQGLENHGLENHGLGFMPSVEAPADVVFNQFNSEDYDGVFNPFSSASILEEQQSQSLETGHFENPQSAINVPPWEHINLRGNHEMNTNSHVHAHAHAHTNSNSSNNNTPPSANEASPIFIIEDPSFMSAHPPAPAHTPQPNHKSSSSPASPTDAGHRPPPPLKPSPPRANSTPTTASKNPRRTPTAPHPSPTSASPTSTSSSTTSTSASSTAASKFLIVTPSSITLNTATQPNLNPFDCVDALARGPTQRGRKGPLATDTKQSALVVRRMGACFSCHARKVRCDKERPCRNCVRLAGSVPQVVCWQFGDFTPVLFPGFIRGHLKREEVVRFVEGNVECFRVGGVEVPCTVALVSGVGFGRRSVLEVRAKFFTARSPDVLQHWHVQMGRNGMDLAARGAAPIGLEMPKGEGGKEGSDGQKGELKKKLREYIQSLVDEPRFAELVTPAPQHTELPRKVLRIVHDYANRCDVPMVRRALSIYAMHFVMTRHLCLTQENIVELQSTGLVPQGVPWVTPRVLNRQIKAVVDEMLCREMQLLFENFSKSLKPKLRREWAPCLASFLVLCLFMESVEMAADLFVISDNEINLRRHYAPAWQRSFVLGINREIENMPFKQFAFQFHQIYQTHSRDAAARSFNPLIDDACFELGELDREAGDMVRQLRRFIDDDCEFAILGCLQRKTMLTKTGSELDYLTADPILPNIEDHPYPRNVAYNYTGRLVAKFLLSFTDEKYIFDGKT